MRIILTILFLSVAIQAQSSNVAPPMTSNPPNPQQQSARSLIFETFRAQSLTNATNQPVSNWYGYGFQTDNQLYTLQGYAVSFGVGVSTKRPWMGGAAGVGSCLAYRAIHDQRYSNDHLLSSNRVAFCAVGSVAAYATNKWVFRIHRNKIQYAYTPNYR
jgi:hypothetical protein